MVENRGARSKWLKLDEDFNPSFTSASISFTRIWREMLGKFVRNTFPLLGISRGLLLNGYIRPFCRIFGVDGQPLLQSRLGIGFYCIDGAFWLANAAVDAFVGVNDEHVLAFIEAVDRANLDAVHEFALDAVFIDNIGHFQNQPFAFLRSLLAGTPLFSRRGSLPRAITMVASSTR
jgi:hypothetical protein